MDAKARQEGVELLVLQPTPFCNLDCSYCYLPDRSQQSRMSLDTVRLVGERIIKRGWTRNELTVIWHAGEPLVVGPDWYEQAYSILTDCLPPHVRLAHAVQTNATLIDARWASLFRRHDVRVGVSLDGPRSLHDSRRRTRDGRGTFDRTMKGVRVLQDAGWPFHVITVLTADSLRCPDELFEFYRSEGIERVCFNVEEAEGVNARSSLDDEGTEAALRQFFRRFFERAEEGPKPMWVRELTSSFAAILAGADVTPPNPQVAPLAILSVDVNGNLSTFSPELMGAKAPEYDDFLFVNLADAGPEALSDSLAFRRAAKAVAEGVDHCRRTCKWFPWCGGGAPANKFFELGSLSGTETQYCRFTKQVVMDVVLDMVEAGHFADRGRSSCLQQ